MRNKDELARIETLQQELDSAREAIGDLGGEVSAGDIDVNKDALKEAGTRAGTAKRWLGAPVWLQVSRRYDVRYPAERFDALVERIREITHDAGNVEKKFDSLLWSSSPNRHPIQPHLMVRVAIVDDHTTLTVTDELGAAVGRLFGAFGTVFGAGGLIAPIAASLALPVFTPMFILGWVGGVYGTTRVMFRKLARARASRVREVFGALALEIDPNLAGRPS